MGFITPGTGLSSQAVSRQVLSLLTVFTVVFEMGTGVFRSLRHQEPFRVSRYRVMHGIAPTESVQSNRALKTAY